MSKSSLALTLWVPNLLTEAVCSALREAAPSELSAKAFPALTTLMSRADVFSVKSQSIYDTGAYLFHQTVSQPPAATMALAQLADFEVADFWLRAELCQMIPDRDSLVLIPAADLGVSEAEAEALRLAFNEHFALDGVRLQAGGRTDWYLRLPQTVDVHTFPLPEVAYRHVQSCYPSGHAAPYWRQLMNEAQMLFFSHPVNEARREAGRPEINSLWFWGEGALDLKGAVRRPNANVCSDDLYFQGLAKLTQAGCQPEPINYQAWSESALAMAQPLSHHLIHLDRAAPRDGTLSDWLSQLHRLEADWFAPLLAALRQGALHSLFIDVGRPQRYHLKPTHLRRFWRRRKSIVL